MKLRRICGVTSSRPVLPRMNTARQRDVAALGPQVARQQVLVLPQ